MYVLKKRAACTAYKMNWILYWWLELLYHVSIFCKLANCHETVRCGRLSKHKFQVKLHFVWDMVVCHQVTGAQSFETAWGLSSSKVKMSTMKFTWVWVWSCVCFQCTKSYLTKSDNFSHSKLQWTVLFFTVMFSDIYSAWWSVSCLMIVGHLLHSL